MTTKQPIRLWWEEVVELMNDQKSGRARLHTTLVSHQPPQTNQRWEVVNYKHGFHALK